MKIKFTHLLWILLITPLKGLTQNTDSFYFYIRYIIDKDTQPNVVMSHVIFMKKDDTVSIEYPVKGGMVTMRKDQLFDFDIMELHTDSIHILFSFADTTVDVLNKIRGEEDTISAHVYFDYSVASKLDQWIREEETEDTFEMLEIKSCTCQFPMYNGIHVKSDFH